MKTKYIKHELEISENLYNVINDYIYEMDTEIKEQTIDEFIINAIVEKFNNENTIFSGKIDKNGFSDGRTLTEHYINIK